ncbi:hypothetical protein PVT68_12870 [Microbulbifer bruguierae]|uniref:Lipoprotein n=1 Tax=Microbulbifer bruguierae TaxID=3029061 RepID=A0ABY8N9S9_9GAMM|nr:hypothetical protein [Microbulbifer bruguierae]WGL15659.1 hypothetical protein PVT68_12870 [Microbulbifer bruguierae]
MFTGKRLLAVIALISLLLTMVACSKQVCYRDGQRERSKPPMPFASVTADLPPIVSLIHPY